MPKGKNPIIILFYNKGHQFPECVVKYFRNITEFNKG